MNILSLLLITLVLLTGCAANGVVPSSKAVNAETSPVPVVKIDSYIDLEKKSERYSQPVVWVRIASLKDRHLLENSVADEFRAHDIDPVPGVDVFPPGVKIASEMVATFFQQSEGDSLLIISLKPDSTLYHMKYDAALYDGNIDKVWIGHVVTELKQTDSANTQIDELMFQATAREIVDKITEDGLIVISE